MTRILRHAQLIVPVVFAIFFAPAALAAACTSKATGNWANAAIWTCVGGPASGDTVTIAAGNVVTLNSPPVGPVASLTVSGTLTVSSSLTVSGAVAISAGYLQLLAGTAMSVGGTTGTNFISLSNSASSVFEMDGGTLSIAGGLASASTASAGTFTMTGGTITMATAATSTLTKDTFVLGSATIFNMSGGTIILRQGNASTNDVNIVSTTQNVTGGTLQFGDASAVAGNAYLLTNTSGGAVNIWNLVAYSATSGNLQFGTTLNVLNSVTINTGATLLDNGAFAINLGGGNAGGSWNNNGTFTPATGTVTFTGTANDSITGTTATTFYNLVVNTSAPATGVTLANAVNTTVSKLLTLTNGAVTTGANTLIVTPSCATPSVSRTNGYVIGNLRKTIPAGASSCTFEVGSGTSYTPAVLAFAAGTTTGTITASTTGTDHPQLASSGIDGANSVNRYWSLTNGGVGLPAAGYSATFNYINGSPVDMDASAIPANFIVEQWNGATWFPTTLAASCTATPATDLCNQITGQTGFGDFAIGDPLLGIGAGTLGAFNIFESTTPAGAVLGRIYTKIQGATISLQVVAVNAARTGVNAAYNTNPITVSLLDSRDNTGAITLGTDCRSSWTFAISTQSLSPVWTNGRSATITITAPANAWRDVRVKVTQGANTGCSSDRFSIRPQAFSSLTSAAAINSCKSGTPVFKAGSGSFDFTAATGLSGYDNGSGATLASPQIIPQIDPNQVVGTTTAGTISGLFNAASGGTASGSSFTYSEVGNFSLKADAIYDNTFTAVDQPNDCVMTATGGLNFSNSLNANGQYGCNFGSPAIALACGSSPSGFGRFIPDHFETKTSGGMPCPTGLTCPTQYNGFVYSGEPFTTNVYAMNAAGTTTYNYDITAGYSQQVTLSAWDALGSTTQQNPPPTFPSPSLTISASTPTIPASSFCKGTTDPSVAPANCGTPATPTYTFGTAAPTAPTAIYIRAKDADGATSLQTPASSSIEGGMMIVSGRMVINSAYGSEFLSLSVPLAAQYWNGTYWTLSSSDSSSAFSWVDVRYSNWQATHGTWASGSTHVITPPSTITFANGLASFKLSSPGYGNTGSVDIDTSLTGTSPSTNAYLPSNQARITFGVYNTNNHFIYSREN